MAWGMKQVPERMAMNPALFLRAMLNPFVAMGIAALILALLTRIALFSLADLSFVLPVTAVGYVIAVFLGKVFLHETVSHQRWLDRIPSEEPFKSTSGETIRQNDPGFAKAKDRFDKLS